MTLVPANLALPDPPPNPAPKQWRSLWKPVGITMLTTFILAFSTCAGGFALGKNGYILLYAGWFFIGLFVLSVFFAVVYFVIWLIQITVSK